MQNIVIFAVETGMRIGEIAAMEWNHINWDKQTLLIPITKTDKAREIPLSKRVQLILKANLSRSDGRSVSVWDISITQAFGRACKRLGIDNLRYHNLRHEAVSRFFEKGLNTMEVALITGHQDLRMLKRYTPTREHMKKDVAAYMRYYNLERLHTK